MVKCKRNIVCMKWGTKFGPQYVNRLYDMVEKNLTLPHRFVCFTDDAKGLNKNIEVFPLPKVCFEPGPERGWNKLGIFRKNLGDLDTIELTSKIINTNNSKLNYLLILH